jgi:hypothetical protein
MYIIDTFRTFILGNPVKIADDFNISRIFLDQMLSNFKFVLLVSFIVVSLIVISLVMILKPTNASQRYLMYVTGAFIVYSAVNFKYSSVITDNDPNYIDSKIINALKEVVNLKVTSLVSGLGFLLKGISHRFELQEDFISNFVSESNQQMQNDNHSNAKDGSTRLNNGKISLDYTGKKINSENEKNKQEFEMERKIKALLANKIDMPGNISLRSSVISTEDISSLDSKSNELNNPKPNLRDLKNKKAKDNMSDVKTANKNDSIGFKSENLAFKEMQGEDIDTFMKDVLSKINDEFSSNSHLVKYFKEINAILESTENDIQIFIKNFKTFYTESMKISEQMLSFDASPKYLKFDAKDMMINVKNVLELGKIIEKLNVNQINNISEAISDKMNPKKPIQSIDPGFWNAISIFKFIFSFQILVGVIYLVAVLCEIEIIMPVKLLIAVSLFITSLFSVYMMLYAHSIDKVCIIGDIRGCKGNFTEGFSKFAESANIDMKKVKNGEVDKVEEAIEDIQSRTADMILREYLEKDSFQKFRYQKLVFKNLFEKIYFIKDDFDKLTDGKVKKEDFYLYVDLMDHALYKIHKSLENIKTEKILDFYTKEIIFLNFLKTHKKKIYMHINKKGNKSTNANQITSKYLKDMSCEVRNANICELKHKADQQSVFLYAGGALFLLLLSY